MKTITVYNPEELKEANPDGFERAHREYNYHNSDIPWTDEIMDSLKALFKASGVNLRDWEIDANGYSYVEFDMAEDTMPLHGPRALAWLENHLFVNLREHRTFVNRVQKYDHWYDFTKYGEIPDCPLTGYCADIDFIESLVEDIKAGQTLAEAYSNLARVASKLFQQEVEQAESEEEFLMQDHLEYTIDGRLV